MRLICLLASAILAAVPAIAHAGACEDGFVKKGNFITGLRFSASQTLADLPPDIAIKQLEGITAGRGYQVIASEPAVGSLLIEQARQSNARGFPLEFTATQENGLGTVRVEAKLPAGMNAKGDDVRPELCGMLAALKGGKAGKLAAAHGAKPGSASAAPTVLSAQEFSQQISKDAERNAAIIPLRYAGRKYTLSGNVDYVIRDGSVYRVAFKILQPYQLAIRLPNMAASLSAVSCLMGPGTSVYTLQLKPGKSVKLTGTFHEYAEFKNVVWFKDCAPTK